MRQFPKILIALFAVFLAASFSVSYLVSGFIEFGKPAWVFICLIPLFQSAIVFFIVQLRGSFSSLLKNLARIPWFWLLATSDAAFLTMLWRLGPPQGPQNWLDYYPVAKAIILGAAALALLSKRRMLDSRMTAACVAAAALFLVPAALIAGCAYANASQLDLVSRRLATSYTVPGLTLLWMGLLMRSRNPDSLT